MSIGQLSVWQSNHSGPTFLTGQLDYKINKCLIKQDNNKMEK